MTTEHASAFRCFKVAAAYTCIWAAALACIVAIFGAKMLPGGGALSNAILTGSLAAVAVGIPVWREDAFRNPASAFFLAVGAVGVTALLFLAPFFAFLFYLFAFN